jgi:hypothetical protein
MQVADRIETIVNRAAAINLQLFSLCKAAGVDYSNVHRWRSEEANPTVRKFEEAMSKLEATLSELEDEVLKSLSRRRCSSA